MNIDWDIVLRIVVPIITLVIAAILNHILTRRPRLIAYWGHVAAFKSGAGTEDEINLFTHTIVVRNAGRKPAKNVRLDHAHLPDFQVSPSIEYNVQELTGGGKEIVFPLLVPGEQITLSYLYFPPTIYSDINRNIKSDEGFGKVVKMLLTEQRSKWYNYTRLMFMGLGAITLIYLIIILLMWIF